MAYSQGQGAGEGRRYVSVGVENRSTWFALSKFGLLSWAARASVRAQRESCGGSLL